MKSAFGPEVIGATGVAPVPAPPAIVPPITFEENVATVNVQLPAVDTHGNPLKALNEVEVYWRDSSFITEVIADVESVLGLLPSVKVKLTPDQAGQIIPVKVPDLPYGTTLHFSPTVNNG